MSKRAVIYARVSTDEQSSKGYSLPSQIEAMRKYAEQQGFSLVGDDYWKITEVEEQGRLVRKLVRTTPNDGGIPAYVEDFTGAVPIEMRPEGRKVYALLSDGRADAIIGYTIDRLVSPPEEGDEWDFPVLIRGLARLGKEIHTCDIGKLKTDFASLLIAMLGAKGAGEERRKIIERCSRGRNTKARSGRVVGGRCPRTAIGLSGIQRAE